MKIVKVGLAQMNVVPGRPDINTKKILQIMKEMKREGIELGIFPEMSVPGYLLGDKWEVNELVLDYIKYMDKIKEETKDGFAVAIGNVDIDYCALPKNKELSDVTLEEVEMLIKNPELRYRNIGTDGRLRKYNSVWVMQNGEYAQRTKQIPVDMNDIPVFSEGRQPKVLDPNYREFDDKRHFHMLKNIAMETGHKIEDLLLPFKLKFKEGEKNIGFMICEDGWFQDYFYNGKNLNPAKILVDNGAQLLVDISTSPNGWKKSDARHRVFKKVHDEIVAGGKEMPPLVYNNCIGIQNNGKSVFIFDGRSAVYDSKGEPKIEMPPFEETVLKVDIDLEKRISTANRIWAPGETPTDAVSGSLDFATKENGEIKEIADSLIAMAANFLPEVPVFIGLSGGIDSAVVAALFTAARMDKINKDPKTAKELQVVAVNMPTRENKKKTKDFARNVAQNLGIPYLVVDIDKNFQGVLDMLKGIDINGIKPDITQGVYENIQPKIRFVDVLSNLAAAYKGIFTCNSNKTEIFFGYETLDGGLRGAAAPIADLYKYQIRALARYLNKEVFKREVIPEELINMKPSAELSESQNVDKGKGDPMIYDYHDQIVKRAIEYREGPYTILKAFKDGTLAKKLSISEKLIADNFKTNEAFIKDLEWAYTSFNNSYFKRVQAPPIFVVSKRGFGFDLRETIMFDYYTQDYQKLKQEMLSTTR